MQSKRESPVMCSNLQKYNILFIFTDSSLVCRKGRLLSSWFEINMSYLGSVWSQDHFLKVSVLSQTKRTSDCISRPVKTMIWKPWLCGPHCIKCFFFIFSLLVIRQDKSHLPATQEKAWRNVDLASKLPGLRKTSLNKSDPWRPNHVHRHRTLLSGTRVLMSDPLSSVGCEVGPQWIGLVDGRPMDAQLHCEPGNLEARPTPWVLCHIPRIIPEQVLLKAEHIVQHSQFIKYFCTKLSSYM